MQKSVEELERWVAALLMGIKEWDLADARDEQVGRFLHYAEFGIYLDPHGNLHDLSEVPYEVKSAAEN